MKNVNFFGNWINPAISQTHFDFSNIGSKMLKSNIHQFSRFQVLVQVVVFSSYRMELAIVQAIEYMATRSQPPRNKSVVQNVSIQVSISLRSVEISEFYCHSDFTWNQFWSFWSHKNCHHFDHFKKLLILTFLEIFDIFKCEVLKESKFKAYKIVKMAFFDLLKSAKNRFHL